MWLNAAIPGGTWRRRCDEPIDDSEASNGIQWIDFPALFTGWRHWPLFYKSSLAGCRGIRIPHLGYVAVFVRLPLYTSSASFVVLQEYMHVLHWRLAELAEGITDWLAIRMLYRW